MSPLYFQDCTFCPQLFPFRFCINYYKNLPDHPLSSGRIKEQGNQRWTAIKGKKKSRKGRVTSRK